MVQRLDNPCVVHVYDDPARLQVLRGRSHYEWRPASQQFFVCCCAQPVSFAEPVTVAFTLAQSLTIAVTG
jgi:hypothetical protein